MNLGDALAAKYGGVPLVLWVFGAAAAYYLLVHHLQNGSSWPAPMGITSARLPVATVPSGPALPKPWFYMPDFPMPVAVRSNALPLPAGVTGGEGDWRGMY